MRVVKHNFFHEAGQVGVDFNESQYIWWKVVYGNPGPAERQRERLI
jgi:hypothetical protein